MLSRLKAILLSKRLILPVAAAILALGSFGLSRAATDSTTTTPPPGPVAMFLQLSGVSGESTDANHPTQIDVNSFDWGSGVPGIQAAGNQGDGGGAGKVTFNDLKITKVVDKSSPVLMQAAASGKHFDKAVLSCRKAGGSQDFMTVTLSDVVVTSYQTSGKSDGVTESITLNFTKVEFKQTSQNTDGTSNGSTLGTVTVQGNRQ